MTTDKDLAWFISRESLRVNHCVDRIGASTHAISQRCGYECIDCSKPLKHVFICCARPDGAPRDSAADVVIQWALCAAAFRWNGGSQPDSAAAGLGDAADHNPRLLLVDRLLWWLVEFQWTFGGGDRADHRSRLDRKWSWCGAALRI